MVATCFVVMGFGQKVDFETGRRLNLDSTYHNVIKPAVEAAGLECVRADEIVHSGIINTAMYERLLEADLVIADVSTAEPNTFYELGVRHALRPYTTLVVSEDKFKIPAVLANNRVFTYRHLGEDIGYGESRRFTAELTEAIKTTLLKEPHTDSPVYIFLNHLRPPRLSGDSPSAKKHAFDDAMPAVAKGGGDGPTYSVLMQQVEEANRKGDFMAARELLSAVRSTSRRENPSKPEDPYLVQQLALATYKSKRPTPHAALEEARELLKTLDPATSNDTETLGLWGAVHKRLWEETRDRAHLDEAVRGYDRGFYLRNDYYNGINLAYMLNVRAANAAGPGEAVADFVEARRVRREVLDICEEVLRAGSPSNDERFGVLATRAEALLGVGDEEGAQRTLKEAYSASSAEWMTHSVQDQLDKLRALLADSPLKYVITA